MPKDPVIEDVRKVKAEIAAKHGYDPKAIAEEARELCRRKGLTIVSCPAKRTETR